MGSSPGKGRSGNLPAVWKWVSASQSGVGVKGGGGGGGGSGESRKQVGPASSSNGVRGNIPPGRLSGVRQFLWGSDTSGKPCAGGNDWLGQKSLLTALCVCERGGRGERMCVWERVMCVWEREKRVMCVLC